MSLTELGLKNLKPKEKRYLAHDGQGLYIEVNPTGRKYWKVRYMVSGKAHKVSLGEYPYVGLREARRKRDDIRGYVVTGTRPDRAFKDVAAEWYETHMKGVKSDGHLETIQYRLERFLYPQLGDKTIREITAPDLLEILRALQNAGTVETARRVKQIAGQVFRYAIAVGEADHDVSADLKGALRPNRHKNFGSARTPEEAKAVVKAIAAYQGGLVVKRALWFSARTFQRPGEIRHAEWTEIHFENKEWRFYPEKRAARQTLHIVPLAEQVVASLQELKSVTGRSRYLFPSLRSPGRPMSENAVTVALRSMGFEKEQMTAHGFRAMASTLLNEHGWPSDAIERQLAHAERNAVRAAYNHAEYLPQRREMMQWWADWLDEIENQ